MGPEPVVFRLPCICHSCCSFHAQQHRQIPKRSRRLVGLVLSLPIQRRWQQSIFNGLHLPFLFLDLDLQSRFQKLATMSITMARMGQDNREAGTSS